VGDERSVHATHGAAPVFADPRGRLTLVESDAIPFEVARSYVLSELPAGVRRAGHACRTQQRFIVGISGAAVLTIDNGRKAERIRLTGGDTLHVPPLVWLEIEADGDGVVILVFADGVYDPSDYVRDRAELEGVALSSAATSARDTVST
jgi:quercetin dioxygenase-like cupin family protein